MTDDDIIDTWTTLEPTIEQRRRIDTRVSAWLDAHDTSIAAEWLSLISVSPFGSLALAAASAVGILALTPLAWFVGALAGVLVSR